MAEPEEEAMKTAAWRDHVEQRLLTWRQRFVNKSGDQLALDDFMDKRSLDDLIDYVCDEYAAPQSLTFEQDLRRIAKEAGGAALTFAEKVIAAATQSADAQVDMVLVPRNPTQEWFDRIANQLHISDTDVKAIHDAFIDAAPQPTAALCVGCQQPAYCRENGCAQPADAQTEIARLQAQLTQVKADLDQLKVEGGQAIFLYKRRHEEAEAECAELRAELAKANEALRFVERWANHHAVKPTCTAESALSVIQHYPPIKAITCSYVDGKVPDTPDPWAERDELRALLSRLAGVLRGAEDEDQGAAYDRAQRLIDAALGGGND